MAINKDSNSYTILFSVVMVVVVGAILSFLSMSLKEPQEKNARDKKQIDILGAVGVEASRQDADTLYNQFIKSDVVIDLSLKIQLITMGKLLQRSTSTSKRISATKIKRQKTSTTLRLSLRKMAVNTTSFQW
jgi:Na+-transporting NADH:ubiquinone oxidoreductase subunit NqrC